MGNEPSRRRGRHLGGWETSDSGEAGGIKSRQAVGQRENRSSRFEPKRSHGIPLGVDCKYKEMNMRGRNAGRRSQGRLPAWGPRDLISLANMGRMLADRGASGFRKRKAGGRKPRWVARARRWGGLYASLSGGTKGLDVDKAMAKHKKGGNPYILQVESIWVEPKPMWLTQSTYSPYGHARRRPKVKR